jgi:hypothetical protein
LLVAGHWVDGLKGGNPAVNSFDLSAFTTGIGAIRKSAAAFG